MRLSLLLCARAALLKTYTATCRAQYCTPATKILLCRTVFQTVSGFTKILRQHSAVGVGFVHLHYLENCRTYPLYPYIYALGSRQTNLL